MLFLSFTCCTLSQPQKYADGLSKCQALRDVQPLHLSPSKKMHLHSSKTLPLPLDSLLDPTLPWSSDEPVSSPSFLFFAPDWSLEHDKDRPGGSLREINEGSLVMGHCLS